MSRRFEVAVKDFLAPTYCWIRASRWRTARDKVKVKAIRSLTVPPDFEGGTLRQSSLVESC